MLRLVIILVFITPFYKANAIEKQLIVHQRQAFNFAYHVPNVKFSLLNKNAQLFQPTYFKIKYKDSIEEKKHSPKKASIYSAILPGLGQVYNRKYWKVPIVLAGLGVSGYFIYKNRDSMKGRQEALIARQDGDSTTNAVGKYANVSIAILTSDRNLYRTYRDYSIIAFAAIYLLNIVDASVDAHFYKFNIDKPLSMQKQRHWYFASSKVQGKPTMGLAYRW